jgi:hypothetical protein
MGQNILSLYFARKQCASSFVTVFQDYGKLYFIILAWIIVRDIDSCCRSVCSKAGGIN